MEIDSTPTGECAQGNANQGLQGTWYSLKTTKTRAVIESYQIVRNLTRITRECHFKTGEELSVTVDVRSLYSANQYQVLDNVTKTTTSGALSCGISVNKGIINYEFYGTCLRTSSNGQSQYLVSQKPIVSR